MGASGECSLPDSGVMRTNSHAASSLRLKESNISLMPANYLTTAGIKEQAKGTMSLP